ncbi:unnamed protein product [Lampetra planeri]
MEANGGTERPNRASGVSARHHPAAPGLDAVASFGRRVSSLVRLGNRLCLGLGARRVGYPRSSELEYRGRVLRDRHASLSGGLVGFHPGYLPYRAPWSGV